MTSFSDLFSLPQSLRKQLEAQAEKDGISPDQFVSSAIAEKIAAISAVDEYLEQRANRASREKFLAVLAKVADVVPDECDSLSSDN